MINTFFELDRLRVGLQNKGVDDRTIHNIVAKARKEIDTATRSYGQDAVDQAVEIGVDKKSIEFINELQYDALNFRVDTESGRMDFSEPPRPMLPHLLKNAKPMKDGSGVYKVIPVGKPGNKAKMSTSIFDAQKRITAERAEQARSRAKAIAPSGSKIEFRVASSKQNPQTQWVQPAVEKDFTEDVAALNRQLHETLDSVIRDIIQGYLDMY